MKVLLEQTTVGGYTHNVWLADGEGDPPRTLVDENAKEFETASEAYTALSEARKYRPFPNAEIQDDFN